MGIDKREKREAFIMYYEDGKLSSTTIKNDKIPALAGNGKQMTFVENFSTKNNTVFLHCIIKKDNAFGYYPMGVSDTEWFFGTKWDFWRSFSPLEISFAEIKA